MELLVVALVWLVLPTFLVGWAWLVCAGIALVTGGLLVLASYFTRSYP